MEAKDIEKKPWEEALHLLRRLRIPFVIVGGSALTLHGIPRTTLDIDIMIPTVEETIRELFLFILENHLNTEQKGLDKFVLQPRLLIGQWLTIQTENGIPIIDIFFEEPKTFDELLARSMKRKFKGTCLAIASLEDLEKMKKEIGRPIDLADLKLIEERKKLQD